MSEMRGAKVGAKEPATRDVRIGPRVGDVVRVHREAALVGYTVTGHPAFVAGSKRAGKWLKRAGYQFDSWRLKECFGETTAGKCWA